jgi:hypothetical protein
VYVVNQGTVFISDDADSVSVISTKNNTKTRDIPVGRFPVDIYIFPKTDAVYVLNKRSDGVSVIDSVDNKAVIGVLFQIKPFDSGYVLCNRLTSPSPTEQYIYVFPGSECIANPNKGYEFLNWEENLQDNSTKIIQSSTPASHVDSIADSLGSRSDDPEATLNITKFASYTANFKALPPPIPSEYLIPLYGIIITTIVGWSIPSIIGWTRARADARRLDYYHKKIRFLYDDGKLDENDIPVLDKLRANIVDTYSKGKLNEKYYGSLKDEISILYERIFRKMIGSLDGQNAYNRTVGQDKK